MSDADKWREYDLAESALLILISHYSKIIDEEESKTSPDMEKVRQWAKEQRELIVLRRGLNVEDQVAIANVRAEYGSAARAALQKYKP